METVTKKKNVQVRTLRNVLTDFLRVVPTLKFASSEMFMKTNITSGLCLLLSANVS